MGVSARIILELTVHGGTHVLPWLVTPRGMAHKILARRITGREIFIEESCSASLRITPQ
jgi:hypothetical protein